MRFPWVWGAEFISAPQSCSGGPAAMREIVNDQDVPPRRYGADV